jgi:hypothetical protein
MAYVSNRNYTIAVPIESHLKISKEIEPNVPIAPINPSISKFSGISRLAKSTYQIQSLACFLK